MDSRAARRARSGAVFICLAFFPGCRAAPQSAAKSLADARRGFHTTLTRHEADGKAAPEPPSNTFRIVHYASPAGKLAAYLSVPSPGGGRHPAIIWIFGGFGNDIGDTAWTDGPPENNQSASGFRKAGIVTMFPSLRGGNDNPGFQESFFGEVDDVLAAADYLAKQDYVDPKRIYLGGHSTGGTLVLLAAECSDRFRTVFSLGPVRDPAGYGADNLVFDWRNKEERLLRAPGRWLDSIHSPVLVFEGTESPGNIGEVRAMAAKPANPFVHYYAAQGYDHFSIIEPLTRMLAGRIVADSGPAANIRLTEKDTAAVSLKALP